MGNTLRIASQLDTLSDSITLFLTCCRAKNLSPRTLEFYAERLKAFSGFISPTTHVQEITA